MFDRVKKMVVKELIQVFRDPKSRPIIFVMPIVQLIIFGYAATTDIRNISTVVLDYDNTPVSRQVIAAFERSGYFQIADYESDFSVASHRLDHGDVQLIIRIDHSFEDDIRAGRSATLQMILDGTDSNTARIVLDYGSQIVAQVSSEIFINHISRTTGTMPADPFEMRTRTWFNENLESRYFFIPGVIALLLMVMILMLTSMAVVREKEIGTMEQVIVTPIRPWEFIMGKSVPFALIGYFDVILITVVGLSWFDLPLRGSIVLLFFATTLYLLTVIGVGLLISTACHTQQQALMTTFFFTFPAILLSGFMFPIANMPAIIQYLTYLDPLRYFIIVIRGIFLKGVGIEILWPELLALAVIGFATFITAAKRFSKTMA